MANILKRVGQNGRVSYKVQIRLKGISRTETFATLADAKKWASIEEGLIQSSRSPLSSYRDYKVGEIVNRYVREVLPKQKSRNTRGPQLEWWKSRIGHLKISEVRPSILTELRNEISQSLANGTVNRYMSALSACFSTAMKDWDLIESNPFSRIRWLKEPRGRERFLSTEEIARLLTVCRQSKSKHLFLFVSMALSTGCRKNEILSLTWSDVDFARNTINVRATKTEDTRMIPLCEPVISLLKEQKASSTTQDIFPHRFIHKGWEKAIERSGLKEVVIHSLRHTCASALSC